MDTKQLEKTRQASILLKRLGVKPVDVEAYQAAVDLKQGHETKNEAFDTFETLSAGCGPDDVLFWNTVGDILTMLYRRTK